MRYKLLTQKNILSCLRSKQAILYYLGVEKIGLIGSFATGKEHENSDIDLVIQFRARCKSTKYFYQVKFFIEQTFEKKIDLILLEENLLADMKEHIKEFAIYV